MKKFYMDITIIFIGLIIYGNARAEKWSTSLEAGDTVCIVDIKKNDPYFWKIYQKYTDRKTEKKTLKMRGSAKKTVYMLLNPGLQSQPPHRLQDGWWKANLIPVKNDINGIPAFTPTKFTWIRLKYCRWWRLPKKK